MHITEENVVKDFCKIINDMNQIMKNIYGNSGLYNFEYGTMISNCPDQVTPYVSAKPVYTKKLAYIEEYINNVSFTIHGKEFFSFFKEYKNNITEVFIGDNYIKFITNLPLVELVFLKDNHNSKPYEEPTKDRLLGEFELLEDDVQELIEANDKAVSIFLNFDVNKPIINVQPADNYLRVIFNKKFLVGLKSTKTFTSDVKLTVYDLYADSGIFIIKIDVVSKNMIVEQYMAVTDVEE